MPLCYEKNKIHALRWRENNYEKTKMLNRKYKATHYTIWKDYLKFTEKNVTKEAGQGSGMEIMFTL